MKTKIYIMTHKIFEPPKEEIYIPLHVGRALTEALGYLGDDTGENISAKNSYYSELTGLYWVAHQEVDADYVGLCHYRRYFTKESGELLTQADYADILGNCDVILANPVYYPKSYYEVYREAHNIRDLDVTGDVLKCLYPQDYEIFKSVVSENKVYSGNMFVTTKERFAEYATWLFSIFGEVERKIDVEAYDQYHKRVFGFLAEQLLYVWVKSKGLRVAECPVAITQEKAETIELKQVLREKVAQRTLEGVQEALMLFREKMKDRPDLTLPASDLSGELVDMFRVLYVCEQELLHLDVSMLDITNNLDMLVKHYRLIERIVKKLLAGTATDEEALYYQDAKVSDYMLDIIINSNPSFKSTEESLLTFRQVI